MLKLFVLFTILALSFAAQGWVGTWSVSNLKGQAYCTNGIIPSPNTNVTISIVNSTSLLMSGTDLNGQLVNWTLPWSQYTNKYEDCGGVSSSCISSTLGTHTAIATGKITYYCNFGGWTIDRTYTLTDVTAVNIATEDDDYEFLIV